MATLATTMASTAIAGSPRPRTALTMAIVIDDSGSMRQTDPRRLSVTAAMIAAQLSGIDDRVALVPLNGAATPLRPGGADRSLLARLHALTRNGAITLYDGPLERALTLLRQPRQAAGPRLVLFLTDGEPNAGPRANADALIERQQRYLRELARPQPLRIYPVLLGGIGQRWRALFDDVARASGGRAFRVAQAGDNSGGDQLIEAFAAIYAAQLGSRVVVRDLSDGDHTLAAVDDFVLYANLVVISRGGPFTVSYAGQRARRPVLDNGADRPTRRDPRPPARPIYHFVDKLQPSGGALTVSLHARGGRGDYRALLIWDYDLLLHLRPPEPDGKGGYRLRAHLARRTAPDRPIDNEPFLRGVKVVTRACPRGGPCSEGPALALSCDGKAGGPRCEFGGRFTPARPGHLQLDALARRTHEGQAVLELPSRERYPVDVAGGYRLAGGKATLRFALDQNQKAPWRDCRPFSVNLSGPAAGPPARLKIDPSDLALPPGIKLAFADGSDEILARPGATNTASLCLSADKLVDRPGLAIDGKAFELAPRDAEWFAGDAKAARTPVEVAITARSWWNRYKLLLLWLGLLLLLLLLLIWIVRGFLGPHEFPANLKVNWGKSAERLDRNEMPLSELPQARRGFYRNAQLWVGGRRCFIESGWPAYARLEATGRSSISLLFDEGTEVRRINKFDPEKRDPVASGALVSIGDAYLVNDLFVRLKL